MRAGLPDTDEGLREVQEQGLLARAQVPKATSAQVIFHDEGCDARQENTQGQGGLREARGTGKHRLSGAIGHGPPQGEGLQLLFQPFAWLSSGSRTEVDEPPRHTAGRKKLDNPRKKRLTVVESIG